MSQDLVLVNKNAGVTTVTLNRPEALNALSSALRDRLAGIFADLATDSETQVIILTGAGRAFSVGLDLKELGGEIPAIDRLFKLAPSAKAAIEAEIQLQRDQEQNGRDEEVGTLMRMVKHILTAEADEEFEL